MDDTAETIILEESNVKVTNRRVVIGSKTYELSDITSVNLEDEQTGMLYAIGIISGVFFLHYWRAGASLH